MWQSQDHFHEIRGYRNNEAAKKENTKGEKTCVRSAHDFSTGELILTFSKLNEGDASVGLVNERYWDVSDTSVVPCRWEYDGPNSCIWVKNNKATTAKKQAAKGAKVTALVNIDQKTLEFQCNNVSQGKFSLVGERFWAVAWLGNRDSMVRLAIDSVSDATAQKPRDLRWAWASRQAHILRYKHLPLNFLILGKFGVGKSSFSNTLTTALQPASDNRIRTPLKIGHSLGLTNHGTTEFSVYQIPGTNFQVFDFWGADGHNLTRGEIGLCAHGRMLPGYKKDPKGNENQTTFTSPSPGPLESRPHAVILAVDGHAHSDRKGIEDFTNTVMDNMTSTHVGFHEITIALTRVDRKLDKSLANAADRTYSSAAVQKALADVQSASRMPSSCIFPVQAYHSGHERDFNLEALILDAFAKAVDQAVRFFRGVVKYHQSTVQIKTLAADQKDWLPAVQAAPAANPTIPFANGVDSTDFKTQVTLEQAAQKQETEAEEIGPSESELNIGVEVDDFAWSKYQTESSNLELFLRSLGIAPQDAQRKARICITMASGNIRNALKYAFSHEYFV